MESKHFDELAIATTRVSRGRALKLVGAAVLALFIPGVAEAKKKRHKHRKSQGKNRFCRDMLVPIPGGGVAISHENCAGSPFGGLKGPPCTCPPGTFCSGCCIDAPPICRTPAQCVEVCGYYNGGNCLASVDGSYWSASTTNTPCTANADCPSNLCVTLAPACTSGEGGSVCAEEGAKPI